MLRKVFQGFCQNRRGRFVVAGAIGFLAGVERLLANQTAGENLIRALPPPATARAKIAGRFTIRRTTSDLGYAYWVLQGFGNYRGFALFDTWREAMDEANRRLARPARSGTLSEEMILTA